MSRLTVRRLEPEDVFTYHDGIVDAFAEVYAEAPWNEGEDSFAGFAQSLYRYAEWPNFRGAVAIDETDKIQGFTLGANWVPDDWWCSRVAEDLGPRAPTWTSDCFRLLELAVRRSHRGEGYGAELYDALVEGLPHRTAILSTNKLGPISASTLYGHRGWKLLLEGWRHCVECEPVQILGLTEPALSARIV